MQFCVSEARLLPQRSAHAPAPPFVGYDIQVNGNYHCTVRYKQLHNLHTQLHQCFPTEKLPDFPPKKLLPLTDAQVEERRILLERYLQLVGQNPILSSSDLITGFLASAQQEMFNEIHREVPLDVYTMLGQKIPLIVSSADRTHSVLEKVCTHLHLSEDFVKYFGLYLMDIDETTNKIAIFKRLEDFESPYISQKTFKSKHKIYIRKSYWDSSYDVILMKDKVALELLYGQTVAEVMANWITAFPNVLNQLNRLQMNDQKLEYMELVRNEKRYGCVLAGHGVAEWNSGGCNKSQVKVFMSHTGLLLVTPDERELFFKVVRMRCWRITSLKSNEISDDDIQNGHPHSSNSQQDINNEPALELSFEYLMSKDSLHWVTILSDKAMFMSVCLQSVVDELMGLKSYCRLYKNGNKDAVNKGICKKNLTYLRRDGSTQIITSNSTANTFNSVISDHKVVTNTKEKFSVKKLTEKFASVSFKSGHDFIENNAFGEIGDDDL